MPSPTSKIRKGFRDEDSSVPDVRDGADDYEYEEYDDEYYEDDYNYGGIETFGMFKILLHDNSHMLFCNAMSIWN